MDTRLKRVLVIEDRRNWQELIGELLQEVAKELGHMIEVSIADCFTDALSQITATSYDLITVDNKLPDGKMAKTVLDRVGELGYRVPVIVISGVVNPSDVRDFFKEYEIDEFFSKDDFKPKKFKKTARKLLLRPASNRLESANNHSASVSVLITLVVASIVFVGLLFGIVGVFKFAVGGNITPKDLIVLTPVAVVLALVLYPFILVLLRVFSPRMAEHQFNQLHDFAGTTFPSLLSWLDHFSQILRRQQEQEANDSPESKVDR